MGIRNDSVQSNIFDYTKRLIISSAIMLNEVHHTSLSGHDSKEVVIHTEENIDPSISSTVRHHFHLHHGDFVRVDVTSTNKAESSTSATSNGLTYDFTEPQMSQLVDGDDLDQELEYTVIIERILHIFVYDSARNRVVERCVHSRLHIYPLCGLFYFP